MESGTQHRAHDVDHLVAMISAQAARLAADTPGGLRRLSLHVGDAKVEMEWGDDGEPRRPDPAAPERAEPDGGEPPATVVAPLVGTFYRAPEPGAAPFVDVGDVVREDTVVGIVEAMKLMNKVHAQRSGVVTAVLVPDGTQVEYEQPLIELDPATS